MLDIKTSVSWCISQTRCCFWMAISTVSQRFMQSNSMLKTVEAYVVRKYFEVNPACFAPMELSAQCKKIKDRSTTTGGNLSFLGHIYILSLM